VIIHTADQGTPEWFQARLGIPTASRFGDILTSQAKPAAAQKKYLNTLLAEHLTGKRDEIPQTFWMQRGTELEPHARSYYEFHSELDVRESGFVTTDDGLVGGSPDGLTEVGGLEIKCPSPAVHVEYLLAGKCPAQYVPQVQGLMWLFGADRWDFVSYHPDFRKQLVVQVGRDDKWQAAWESEIKVFNDKLQDAKHKLLAA
jgi:hypothetical protein